jgi:hypothetical protein
MYKSIGLAFRLSWGLHSGSDQRNPNFRAGDHMTHQGAGGTQGCTGNPRLVRVMLWVTEGVIGLTQNRHVPVGIGGGGVDLG